MDKFLLSSPTLAYRGNENNLSEESKTVEQEHVDPDHAIGGEIVEQQLHFLDDTRAHRIEGLEAQLSSSQESLDEVVPVSKNIGLSPQNWRVPYEPSSYQGGLSDPRGVRRHQSNLSTSSVVSLSQNPPTDTWEGRKFNFSCSESEPQLPSTFNESPGSYRNATQQYTPQLSREKSMSMSSASTFNLYTTPMKTPGAYSPINQVPLASRISKTPSSIKRRGHSRSRSRLSSDTSNGLGLMNINLQRSTTGDLFSSNSNKRSKDPELLNGPFSMPTSFVFPEDKIQFGLQHNSEKSLNAGQLISTHAASDIYGVPLDPQEKKFGRLMNSRLNDTGLISSPVIGTRRDPLDAINVEEAENDAVKELNKTRVAAGSIGTRSNMDRRKQLAGNIISELQGGPDDILEETNMPKEENVFLHAADLSLKMASQYNSSFANNEMVSTCPTSREPSPNLSPLKKEELDVVPQGSTYSFPPIPKSTWGGENDDISSWQENGQFLFPQMSPDQPEPMYKDILHNSDGTLNDIHLLGFDTQDRSASSQNMSPIFNLPSSAMNINLSNSRSAPHQVVSEGSKNLTLDKSALQDASSRRPLIKVLDRTDTIDPKKKHPCPICKARFQRPEHVKRHLKSHSSEKPFECDEPNCGKRFNRKDNLKAHIKKLHHRDPKK